MCYRQVEHVKHTFAWTEPDQERLRDVAYTRFGWDIERTDSMVVPLIRKHAAQVSFSWLSLCVSVCIYLCLYVCVSMALCV